MRDRNVIQAGDILGFSGDSWVSTFITLVTYGIPGWSLSHVGIVGEYHDQLLLFESTTLDGSPCFIRGQTFAGTQAHRIDRAVADYPGKVWHYPLYRELYKAEKRRLNRFLLDGVGIPYDEVGAFRAGGIGFSWFESLFREQDLNSIFCSEWAAAAHAHIGIHPTDNASKWSPNSFVRSERRAGVLLRPRRLK